MQTISRKYYAKVPVINGFENDHFWSELDAKTLAHAQCLAKRNGCMTEIAIQRETGLKVISAKNANSQWELVYGGMKKKQERLATERTQYQRNGKLFAREDWYESGFQHEKENNKTIKDTRN